MRIGILSDTHDQVRRTAGAVRLLADAGAEALIHCGDLTGPDIVYECALLPSYYVFGNNDFDEDELRRAMAITGATCLDRAGTVMFGGRTFAVTHGDQTREIRRLTAAAPDYFLFGHTHLRTDNRIGSTRYINPGALHRASSWTVALLNVADDDLRFLDVADHRLPPTRRL